MATFTISIPDEIWNRAKTMFPEVNWNQVIKLGILRRLKELKKFEELKNKGMI
ncbi:MAG: hypothetical protein AABX29_01510 [Nanoarchaeota archaeon]